MNQENVKDGRKYQIGEAVDFTDDSGKVVPGIVHAVRYQQGRYELVGAHRPDMHRPEGPDNMPIPGTGQMELVSGTENERHSFEYIMVHKHEHEAWHKVEASNQKKLKTHNDNIKRLKGSVHPKDPYHVENFKDLPPMQPTEGHPPLKQHVRVYEEDDLPVDTPA